MTAIIIAGREGRSEEIFGDVGGGFVGEELAAEQAEVRYLLEGKGCSGRRMRRAHAEEVHAVDVDQGESRTQVGLLRSDLDVAELEVFNVADEETRSRKLAEHGGLRVFLLALRRLQAGHFRSAAANLMQIDVADFH